MDVSSLLQRERTALKIMLQLLVEQKDTLKLGDIVPVGDLFDAVAEGDEAFSDVMRVHFDNAKKLYQQKLRPILERDHGLTFEQAALLNPLMMCGSLRFEMMIGWRRHCYFLHWLRMSNPCGD